MFATCGANIGKKCEVARERGEKISEKAAILS